MLKNETMNQLKSMKLNGLLEAWKSQDQQESYQSMSFDERLGLLIDWEFNKRQTKKLERLIQQAKFQNRTACVEDISYAPERKLDQNIVLELAACNYILHGRNVLISGATGAGKSFLAQALGQAACRRKLSVRYVHLQDLLDELRMAQEQSPSVLMRLRKQFCDFSLLIVDEWLLFPISEDDAKLLLALIDRRHQNKSTIVISQLEPAEWLDQIPNTVAAEAITDRLASSAYRIVLQGDNSMRRLK